MIGRISKLGTICLVFWLLNAFRLAYAQNPVPYANQPLIPTGVPPGGPGFVLTVNGTGFVQGAAVTWNTTPLVTTFVSSSQLTAVVPAANIATANTASVTVVNPAAAGSTIGSNTVFFSVRAPSSSVFYSNASGSPLNLGFVDQGLHPNEPASMAVGDFNADGKLDVALAIVQGANPTFLMTLLGQGDGTFTSVTTNVPVGVNPGSMAAADFNGDGKLDLVVTDFNGNSIIVLLGNGDGTFNQTVGSPISVGVEPSAIVAADFNGDGKLDLAVTNSSDNNVTILLGNGDGTFSKVASSPATELTPFGLAVGDFNSDGKLDLAVASVDSNAVTILLGNGDGTFTSATSPAAPKASAIATADFNGDGKLDLAVPSNFDGDVAILLGNGDGTFEAVNACCGTSAPNTNAVSALVGDFNGDGKLDLALPTVFEEDENLAGYTTILLGNGDGTFTASNFTVIIPNEPLSAGMGDFNNDGELDFATASQPTNDVSVLVQNAPGPAPDFTLAILGSAASVQAGNTATYSVQLSSLHGFLGSVSISCSGAPKLATCSAAASPLLLFDTETSIFNLTVTTTAPMQAIGKRTATIPRNRSRLGTGIALLGIIFAVPLMLVRRPALRVRTLGLTTVLLCVTLFLGCGGGSSSSAPPAPVGGTPPGNYTLTVEANAGQLTHSTTTTLTVQ